MGKSLNWVREEANGRLIFRRRYPEKLRPFLPKAGAHELKVPLGSKTYVTPEAFQLYEAAKRRFDRNVKLAKAAQRRLDKEASSAWDDPMQWLSYLGDCLVASRRQGTEQRLQQGHGRLLGQGWAFVLAELRQARLNGDTTLIEGMLGPTADDLAAEEGLRFNPEDQEARSALLWALSARLVQAEDDFLKQTQGYAPPIPARPERPTNPRGRARTVAALLDAYKAAKWEGWGESSRKAIAPVLRLLRDAIGDQPANGINRATAREVFELVKRLPVNLGKLKALDGLTVPEAVEEAARLGLPTIGPNTVNKAYMVQIAAVYNWAVKEEWSAKNPFTGLSMDDPVDDRDRRESYTTAQLTQLFSAAPWAERQADDSARPGRYWIPLVALYSGMRLGEIAGLRLMDVEELEGILAFRVRPHELRGLKNKESRRDLPAHSALLDLGFASFVDHRRKVAAPTDILFPDAPANSRIQAGAKLGERFSKHLRNSGITGTKLGMHSFRHNFEDRLRAAGLHGRPEGQALGGRKIAGSEASYGGAYPIAHLQEALEKVTYPGLDLSHLKP